VSKSFDWRTASDDEVELEYSPSRHALRPLAEYLAEYNTLSAPYWERELCSPGQPMLIYIHGGYWQRLSAEESLYNAADAGRLGISLHSVEYTLAPAADIPQMINECVQSIASVIAEYSPSRVVLSGCSAGAHLAAMSAINADVAQYLDGVALLSGIFDVQPFTRISDNEALQLTLEEAAAVSPLLMEIPQFAPHALCAVGTAESGEFIRQSIDMADHLKRHGVQATSAVVPNRDHFNLPYDLLREGTVVGDWVLNILQH